MMVGLFFFLFFFFVKVIAMREKRVRQRVGKEGEERENLLSERLRPFIVKNNTRSLFCRKCNKEN